MTFTPINVGVVSIESSFSIAMSLSAKRGKGTWNFSLNRLIFEGRAPHADADDFYLILQVRPPLYRSVDLIDVRGGVMTMGAKSAECLDNKDLSLDLSGSKSPGPESPRYALSASLFGAGSVKAGNLS